jgi:hypothetical protein
MVGQNPKGLENKAVVKSTETASSATIIYPRNQDFLIVETKKH